MYISEIQKEIYNIFLESLANSLNRPFTPREDFFDFPTDKLEQLIKVCTFFEKHPHINKKAFFDAPYKVFSDKKTYYLDFYSKPNALKTYFLYINLLDNQNPDEPDNLEAIKNGIIFIKNFCLEKKIKFSQYINYSESVTYSWCQHLLSQNITIYNILAFSSFGVNIYMMISNMPGDERELFLGHYETDLNEYRQKYNDAKKARVLLNSGYKKIEKIIEDGLTK